MYCLIKLDDITTYFILLSAIGLVVCICIGIVVGTTQELRKHAKSVIVLIVVLFTLLTVGVFLPTTKQAAAIIVLPKIINNQQVQEIPNKILDLGLEWLEELKPKKEK